MDFFEIKCWKKKNKIFTQVFLIIILVLSCIVVVVIFVSKLTFNGEQENIKLRDFFQHFCFKTERI